MPTYPLTCDNCGNTCQITVPMSERDTDVRCADCGEIMRREFVVPAGIIYKGSGWYATDKVLDEPTEDDLYPDPLDTNPYNDFPEDLV